MEKLLRILKELNPDIDYTKETSLIEDGIFDSLEILTIVTEVESAFRIELNPEDITIENFNSANKMMKMISKYTEA